MCFISVLKKVIEEIGCNCSSFTINFVFISKDMCMNYDEYLRNGKLGDVRISLRKLGCFSEFSYIILMNTES